MNKVHKKHSTGLDRSNDFSVNWPQATRPSLLFSPVIYSPTNNTKLLITSLLISLDNNIKPLKFFSHTFCNIHALDLPRTIKVFNKQSSYCKNDRTKILAFYTRPSVSGQVCASSSNPPEHTCTFCTQRVLIPWICPPQQVSSHLHRRPTSPAETSKPGIISSWGGIALGVDSEIMWLGFNSCFENK